MDGRTKLRMMFLRVYWVSGLMFFGSMPFTHCGQDPSASDTELDALSGGTNYAQAVGLDPEAAGDRRFISEDEVDAKVLEDLRKLSRQQARRTRYLTLTHLYNAGASEQELRLHRAGVAKFINHLSYARDIVLPEAIDPEKTIYRINLDDYRLSERTWLEIIRRYPYALFTNSREEREIRNLTGTSVPRVKADWFANEAGQGNLYYFIMRIFGNVRNLEFQILGRTADDNVRRGNVIRAATALSGVSANNRMVERHEQRNGGFYWKSYDFNEPNGRRERNIFEFPLESRNFGVRGFQHAGGEMIYSLPNGLQAYVLTDANGNLLTIAPVEIVQDRRRAIIGTAEVKNGVACMGCHVRGMQQLQDQLRAHVEKNAFAYDRFTLGWTRRLYPGADAIRAAYAKDMAMFKAAMDKLGWSIDDPEPSIVLANRYDEAMPKELVAAELGLKPDDLLTRLQRSTFLSRRIGQLQNNGLVKREVFEDNFFNIVRELRLGDARFGRGGIYADQNGQALPPPSQAEIAGDVVHEESKDDDLAKPESGEINVQFEDLPDEREGE